ncbi:hypothetical protein ACFX15_046099 [Malus domestica]
MLECINSRKRRRLGQSASLFAQGLLQCKLERDALLYLYNETEGDIPFAWDNLWKVPIDAIKEVNGLTGYTIDAGKMLIIP